MSPAPRSLPLLSTMTLMSALSSLYAAPLGAQQAPPREGELVRAVAESRAARRALKEGALSATDPRADPLYRGDMFALQGDVYRAITQYELYLMEQPPADEADAVRLKIAWMYLQSEKLPAAASALKEIIENRAPYDRLAVWARLYYADVARLAEQGNVAQRTYQSLIGECQQLVEFGEQKGAGDSGVGEGDCRFIEAYAALGLASHHAGQHDFERVTEQLRSLPQGSPLKPKAEAIAVNIEGIDIPRKRPVLAGALSIVPGLGHIYIEQYGQGLVAAAWNGVFIWALVDSARDRNFGQVALIGLVESVWYFGTMFGASAGAHRFNRDARAIVEQGVKRDIERIDDPKPWTERFPTPGPTFELNHSWAF